VVMVVVILQEVQDLKVREDLMKWVLLLEVVEHFIVEEALQVYNG
jgi:hypothetical protein